MDFIMILNNLVHIKNKETYLKTQIYKLNAAKIFEFIIILITFFEYFETSLKI